MIVPAPTIRPLLAGQASVVRVLAVAAPPVRPGLSISLRPRHDEAVRGRVIVLDVETTVMGALTVEQAREEGWGGRHPVAALCRAWLERHDRGYRAALAYADDDEVMDRMQRHAEVEVLRVRVEPDPTRPPRLLAARSEVGYTSTPALALDGEPEAVEPWVQDELTRVAQARAADAAAAAADEVRALADQAAKRAAVARDLVRRHGLGRSTSEALRITEAQLRRVVDDLQVDRC